MNPAKSPQTKGEESVADAAAVITAAESLIKAGQLEEATALLQSVQDTNAKARVLLSDIALAGGLVNNATDHLEEGVKISGGSDPEVLGRLGVALMYKKKWQRALECLQKAKELHGDTEDPIVSGNLKILENFKESNGGTFPKYDHLTEEAEFLPLIEKEPFNVELRLAVCSNLMTPTSGDVSTFLTAKRLLDDALSPSPPAAVPETQTKEKVSETKEGEEETPKGPYSDSERAALLHKRGWLFASLFTFAGPLKETLESADEQTKETLSKDESVKKVLEKEPIEWLQMAEADLELSVLLNGEDEEAWCHLGEVRFKFGTEEKEEPCFEAIRKSVSLKPSYVAGWLKLGFVLFSRERVEESIEAYERAVQLPEGKDWAEADEKLGILYKMRGEEGKGKKRGEEENGEGRKEETARKVED